MEAHKHYKDKMPCLRAYAPSGIRTHDPLIMSQEHNHYTSAPTLYDAVPSRSIEEGAMGAKTSHF